MSNADRKKLLGLMLLAANAWGQSPSLIESLRFHRAGTLESAQSELAACQRQACDRQSHLSLLVGTLMLAKGDAKGAISQLLSTPAPPSLESFHAYHLGEAQARVGDPKAASSWLARAMEGPRWLALRAKAGQAEALLKLGQADAALALLDEVAAPIDTAETYYQRAMAHTALGDTPHEIADLKVVALRFSTHPLADAALDRLAEIRLPSARLSQEEVLERAKSLIDAARPGDALRELRAPAKGKGGGADARKLLRARRAFLTAQALFALNKETEAHAQLATALRGPPSVAAEALLLLAHRALQHDDQVLARKYMVQLNRRFPKERAAEEAGFFVGWLDLKANQLEKAVASFSTFERRRPRSRWKIESLWFHALALMLQDEREEASAVLRRLLQGFSKSDYVPQARYWLARSGMEGEELINAYEEIIHQFPGSFYALLSAARLEELGHQPPPAFPDPLKAPDGPVPPSLQLGLALEGAGLIGDAERELREQIKSVDCAADAVQMGRSLQQFGEHALAYELARRHLWAAAYGRREGSALALLYPLPYREAVEREAKRQNLDPFLIWAVMRQESAFVPSAISSANAHGLMQLLPKTAGAISKALLADPPKEDDLLLPETNIRLATWYLARLLERFKHLAFTLGAYNAGPKVAARWIADRPDVPLDLFVEEIPYKQTRAYVKQVVADYFIYRALYGASAPPLKLSLSLPVPSESGVNF